MSSDAAARRQPKVAFDALAERLVKELATAAQADAEAAATRAREEAEQAAEAILTSTRADAEARLSAAKATNAGLLQSVEGARAEVQTLEQRVKEGQQERQQLAQTRDETAKRLEAETRRANEAKAHLDAEAQRASELATRFDGEKQRASELATRLDGETRRASDLASQFDGETRRASDLASQLEGERRRTNELAAQLEGETRRAKGLTEQIEAETRRNHEIGTTLEGARRHLDVLVDRVGAALSAIDHATSPSEILETLLEPMSRDFAVAAVFLVSPKSLNGWRHVGLGASTDVTKVVIARDGDSLLARAAAERQRLFVSGSPRKPLVGLLGNAVARAAVLPVLAGEQVVAVVYGEDPTPTSAPSPGPGGRITEMLIDHANLRLAIKRPVVGVGASARTTYSQARQAPRVKSREGLDLTVDGAQSALVDVSSMGAQILSPVAMKPNRTLRMMLRAGEQALACKARVIWARFEQPRDASAARYRVGVKFTDVERGTVDDFLAQQGLVPVTQ